MSRQFAFYFDSTSCSGCKACQVACKDKHGLEVGRLWRRVYEVSGGGWQPVGSAWQPNVFAYNLSLSCNHCEQPICIAVCPARAISKRADGIVLIDEQRCIGCKYCSWACPYGAPQYNTAAGYMTKCTFCADSIDAGLPPACVAACPLRVLDFGERADLTTPASAVAAITPMPAPDLTQPALLINPHKAASHAQAETARIANLEEVRPTPHSNEHSLVIFTLLTQMAVGAFLIVGLFSFWGWPAKDALLAVGLLLGLGTPGSLLHLGRPLRAYRALANWRSSWLSREIVCVGLFAAGWMAFTALQWLAVGSMIIQVIVFSLATLAGLALVYSMVRVYRLPTVPSWNTWTTPTAFFTTTFLLGSLAAGLMLSVTIATLRPAAIFALAARYNLQIFLWIEILAFFIILLLIVKIIVFWQRPGLRPALALAGIGMLLCLTLIPWANQITWQAAIIAFTTVLILISINEVLGRFEFYAVPSSRAL